MCDRPRHARPPFCRRESQRGIHLIVVFDQSVVPMKKLGMLLGLTVLYGSAAMCLGSEAPAVKAGHAKAQAARTGTTFAVSFPAALSAAPLDGRIILLLSKDLTREPRSHVEPNEPLASPYLFGVTVDGLAPNQAVRIDDAAFGWPADQLSKVPPGDYLVQAVLNRYETFHLADGRVLKLPPDKGEGQQWATKPGNLYSKPANLHIDPAHPKDVAIVLDQEVPPIIPKPDTEFVKHVRIRSEMLSKFWGRDMYIGAYVLLPKDFDAHPNARFPLMVFHGHFPTGISDFRTTPPDPDLKPEYSRAVSSGRLQPDRAARGVRVLPEMDVSRLSQIPGDRNRSCKSLLR